MVEVNASSKRWIEMNSVIISDCETVTTSKGLSKAKRVQIVDERVSVTGNTELECVVGDSSTRFSV